ncbi:hypothetical protein GCM10027605_42970 [Micromonospora zhanjiangensis]
MMGERVLIVNQGPDGHRLVYVRLLVDGVLARSGTPVLAMPRHGFDAPEFGLHLGDVADRCVAERIPDALLTPALVRRLAVRTRCDRVLVPDGDRFAIRLGVTGWRHGAELRVLVVQDPRWSDDPRPAQRLKMAVKRWSIARARRFPRVRVLCLADQRVAGSGSGENVADPVVFDAGQLDPSDLRQEFGLPPDRYLFVVVGAMSRRKNLPMVVRSVLSLADSKVGLFVCGQIGGPVRDEIAPLLRRADRMDVPIVLSDRLHSDHELNRAIQAADCVVVAYCTSTPNSSMAKAALAGRRAVVVGSEHLRMWARNAGIDLTGPLEQSTLEELMRRAVSLPAPAPVPGADPRDFADSFLC